MVKDLEIGLVKPSSKKQHSKEEWVKSIQDREAQETLLELRTFRKKLGQFTMRFMLEAIYGDDYVQQAFGDNFGEILMEKVDATEAVKQLARQTGGKKSQEIVTKIETREVLVESKDLSESETAQLQLLKTLLKSLDPKVIRKLIDE